MPNRYRQRLKGEGAGEFDERIHVRRSAARGREPLERERVGDDRVDGALLSRDVERRLAAGSALRAAQLSLMRESKWSSPFYWAPSYCRGNGVRKNPGVVD